MSQKILEVFLFIYIIYALIKFFEFFFRSDEAKQKGLEMVYERGQGKIIKVFDDVMLVIMIAVLLLLSLHGVEYLNFITGLLVGMTIIQIYFHRFSIPLSAEKSPKPPITALKLMSYSIQANPGRAWKELLFMTLLFAWALYMLASKSFGWF
jgi:hypothetical protein